jgi:penicillin V acylase-like amidase (Ntn superfamily)
MKRKIFASVVVAGVMIVSIVQQAHACTSILVTKGASKDGSTMITYSMDSHELYGKLTFRPAGVHLPGTQRDIFSGETSKFLGRIKEARPYQ